MALIIAWIVFLVSMASSNYFSFFWENIFWSGVRTSQSCKYNVPSITTVLEAQRLKWLSHEERIVETNMPKNRADKHSGREKNKRKSQWIVKGCHHERYKDSRNTKMKTKSHGQDDMTESNRSSSASTMSVVLIYYYYLDFHKMTNLIVGLESKESRFVRRLLQKLETI